MTAKRESFGKRFLKWWFPWKGDSVLEVFRKLLFLVAVIVFVGAAGYLGNYLWQRYQSQQTTDQIAAIYQQSEANLSADDSSKFDSLCAINPDIRGWISIPDTTLNYSVLQSTDNDYYLHRNIYRNYDINGVPFLDYRNEISQTDQPDNMIIYGHHMNFDGVFGVLVHYNNLDFYREHPTITFDTIYKNMQWEVVAGFYAATHSEDEADGTLFEYQNYIDLHNKRDYDEFIGQITKRSVVSTGVDVEYGDKFITLSTCANEFRDGRFVVVARLVREGENPVPNVLQAKYNPDPLYPAVWRP